MDVSPIGYARTPFPTKFGIPRQPGLAGDVPCELVFERREGVSWLLDMPAESLLWAIWVFSHNEQASRRHLSLTVRPPILGGTRRLGVFATRSSFRPNPLAISALRVTGGARIDGRTIVVPVSGADMADGTPLLDVRPYLPETDAHPDARQGWRTGLSWPVLEVEPLDAELEERVPAPLRSGLSQVLAQDPRPAYTRQGQEDRTFWMPFAGLAVFFKVAGRKLHVVRIEELEAQQQLELERTGSVGMADDRGRAERGDGP